MTTKHTPGPWGWDSTVWDYDPVQEAPWLVTTEGDRVLSGSIQCTSKANARLIAAAPDLLEALQGFIEGAEAMGWSTKKARAAIAKATGETQ